ncbi:hypothetical protein D3C80_1594280 [compost metagenome]
MPDFQADVPEQGEEAFDRLAKAFVVVAAQQDQQVDVRVGVQFATAIAAHRQQGDVGVCAPLQAIPGFSQDLVGEPGAILDQSAYLATLLEARVEHLVGAADGFLEGLDGAGLERQLGLELPAVEQLGVYLRHAPIFLYRAGEHQADVRAMVSSLRRVKIS